MACRRTTPDSNDDQYKVPLQERFLSLSGEGRQRVVAGIPKESCRPLAERLLLDDEISAALNRQDVPYPASEIVEAWSRKRASTIWILRDALDTLRLDDALAELEKARLDYVTIYAVIMGDTKHFKEVPGRKPLKEIIRPYIYRQLGRNMTHDTIQVLRLTRIGDFEQELTWSSPAMLFKAQQIDINIEQRKLDAVHRHTDQPGKSQERVRVERNVISWIDNDSLFFEYDQEGTPSAQPDFDLGKAVQEEAKEERPLSDGMAEMSLTKNDIFGETKKRNSGRKERTVVNPVPTACQSVEISNEDTLREHLVAEGDFVVQQIQKEGCKTLRLSVLHGDRILQYPITEQSADSEELLHFSISDSGGGHAATDVQQLIDYYQYDGHHLPHLPSLPPVQVEDDRVYLKTNVTERFFPDSSS